MGAGVKPLWRELTKSLRAANEEAADLGGVGDKFRQGMRGYAEAAAIGTAGGGGLKAGADIYSAATKRGQ